jgi:peptidoglycan/LPS O-acetylase OafA/YrhL
MVTRIVLAVVIAVAIGIILVALLGPVIAGLDVPIAKTIGHFFEAWGFIIGVLAGLWYFFAGGGISLPGNKA